MNETRWIPFVNVDADPSVPVPAGAAVEPAGGYDAKGRLRIQRPTSDNSVTVLFNGPRQVDGQSSGVAEEDRVGGVCCPPWPMAAIGIHDGDLPFTPPANAGTVSGQWMVRVGGTGFRLVGSEYGKLVTGVPAPGTGSGSSLVSETDNEASTEMAVDSDEAAPIQRVLRRDFVLKKGATPADPKTWALRYLPPVTFLEKLCPTYKWLSIADGVLVGSDTDNGGVKVLADLTPQRKTAKLPGGAAITNVACTGLDTTCCESSWWCTGPDGSPAWTAIEVAYGDTPPTGAFGPYETEEAATTACVDPDDPGDPVTTSCCPDNPLPRTLTLTEVGGGSYPLVYDASYGGGSWLSYPSDSPGYPGLIGSPGCQFRFVLNGGCTVTANLDGGIHCAGEVVGEPTITCDPFSYSFDMLFSTFGGSCSCIGETRSFIITE